MSEKCTIIPSVINQEGKEESSRLFKDLLAFTKNREEAKSLYLRTKSAEFVNEWVPRLNIELDGNGEPTIESLLDKTNLTSKIGTGKILEKFNRDIGHYPKGFNRPRLYLMTEENYKMLTSKARTFNNSSPYRRQFVANVHKILDNESSRVFYSIGVEYRDKINSIEAAKMDYDARLNERLRDILASKGISVGALTDLEERRGISGVTDFSKAKDATEGIIELIRIANGIRGEKALPEEFAHFALRAMGDNPLVNRLINNLSNSGLVADILGNEYSAYETAYEGNEAKLAEEAAGKLLAKHLLQNNPVENAPHKNLLERVIQAIKDFFKNLNASEFQKAMLQADSAFAGLANDILNGQIDEAIDIKNLASDDKFFNLEERVKRDKDILNNILETESKRLKIYEKRNLKGKFSENQRILIDDLERHMLQNNEIEGIYMYISNALEELKKVSNRLSTLMDTPAASLNEKASVLRDIRNYMYSYKGISESIREALREEERSENNRYESRMRVALDGLDSLLNDLFVDYNKVALPLFADFIRPFMGDSLNILMGKNKGKTYTVEDLIQRSEKDISYFDRWLDSMADSSDPMLRVIDKAVKKSKENARLSTIDLKHKIESATLKLEKSGVKDTAWMFERDSKGNLTGNYITEINHALFRERMKAMFARLQEKYGSNPVGEDLTAYNAERRQWFQENMETVDGVRMPKKSIYESTEYKNLNAAQKEYYNTIMEIKADLDAMLPTNYTKLNSAIKIRKDLLERVKSSDGIISGAKQFWEAMKDEIIRRSDDTDFGDKATILDFEKREVQMLPIYYTKMKEGESMNDLSTDVASTMIAYAAMANDFNEMSKVINVLEVGRTLMRERQIQQNLGGKPLKEKFSVLGRKIENNLMKNGEDTNFMNRLNDFFNMQVYGRYMKDEGTILGKIDVGKAANLLNRMTSVNNLAINLLSGISNVATGKVMMRIEAIAAEFFNERDVLKADSIYSKNMPAFLSQVGNRVRTDKLYLWLEKFNVLQEYEQDMKEVNFDRKTWFSKIFGSSTLFILSNAGEHWMQTRTSLALANAYKMKAPNGKIVNLWDAMEVVPLDGKNKRMGASLQLKPGYTKADGSEFTQDDIIKFSRKSAAINQRMHGIYNKLDRSAAQQLAIGRLALMFRKWIKPSLNRRFKSAAYNHDLEAWTEGYYLTTGNFLLSLAKDLRKAQFDIASKWKELTPTEKANIRRALTEVGHFLSVMAILGLIEWGDDKDRPWLVKMTEYQLRRLHTELGSMTPNLGIASEGLRILQSPAAGINTIEKLMDLTALMNPYNYETFNGEDAILQSGPYKGKSRVQQSLLKSPLAPMYNTVMRTAHIEDQIPFFKQ